MSHRVSRQEGSLDNYKNGVVCKSAWLLHLMKSVSSTTGVVYQIPWLLHLMKGASSHTHLQSSLDCVTSIDELDHFAMQAIVAESQKGQPKTTYAAVMAACEKAGQWELAVKLFEQVDAATLATAAATSTSLHTIPLPALLLS